MGLLPRLLVEAEGRKCTQAICWQPCSAVSRTANPPGVSAKKEMATVCLFALPFFKSALDRQFSTKEQRTAGQALLLHGDSANAKRQPNKKETKEEKESKRKRGGGVKRGGTATATATTKKQTGKGNEG